MKTAAAILVVSAVLTGAAGCGNHTAPHVAIEPPATPAQRNFDAVWRSSLDVLRAYRFRIDRQDRRAGIITTRPMLAKHWFEFWRHDALCVFDMLEGTLQTVMRRAEVRIAPLRDRPDEYEPVVFIEVTRPDRQGLEIVGASEAYGRFLDTYDPDDTAYERHKRHKRAKRQFQYKLMQEGLSAAEEAARASGYISRPPERLGAHEALARKLTAEIRAAAKRLGQGK